MEEFSEYQDLLVKRSIKAAVEWSGFGMTFITGVVCALAAGFYQVKTGEDAQGWDKAITAAMYAVPSFLVIMSIYFLIWYFLVSPYVIWKEQKAKISELKPEKLPALPVSIKLTQRENSETIEEPKHSRTKAYGLIASDFNTKTEVDFEVRHTSVSTRGHATLARYECQDGFSVSPLNDQGICILNSKLKTSLAPPEELVVYEYDPLKNLDGAMVSMQTGFCKELIIENILTDNFHELDFVFSKAGYEPLVIKYYVDLNGILFLEKPQWWPEYNWKFPEW